MRKLVSAVVASTVIVGLASGCAIEGGDEADIGSVEESACTNSEGTNSMIAALAVAVGSELKRWKVSTDFKLVTGAYNQQHLALTPTGLAQCSNGCANVKALLFFQDARYDQYIVFPDGIKLSAWSYAARLVAGYNEQKVCESRPGNNSDPNNCPAEEHKLTLASTSPGACDTNFTFNARTPSGGALKTPALLKNKLLWAGGSLNPYLAFTSTNGTVTIDPTFGLNDGPNTSSGSCYTGCIKISTTTSYAGKCCEIKRNGTTQVDTMVQGVNSATYKCPVTNCP